MKFLKNEKGQTAVEYIFLIAVISVILFSIMTKLRARMGGDGKNCKETPLAPVCMFKAVFNESESMNFRYFTIRR